MGRERGEGVNCSPRAPEGMGILEIADVLEGLLSRSMRRGMLEGVEVGFRSGGGDGAEGFGEGGLGGDGDVVVVEALRIGVWQMGCWRQW